MDITRSIVTKNVDIVLCYCTCLVLALHCIVSVIVYGVLTKYFVNYLYLSMSHDL